jgi:hypothetical protein
LKKEDQLEDFSKCGAISLAKLTMMTVNLALKWVRFDESKYIELFPEE